MNAVALLMLQSVAPPTPAEVPLIPPKLDVADPCKPDQRDIVVCGRRTERSPYRLPLPREDENVRYAPQSVNFRLPGGIDGAVHVEPGAVGGIPTNRIMMHLRLKF